MKNPKEPQEQENYEIGNIESKNIAQNQLIPLPILPIHLQCLMRQDKNPHIFNMTLLSETKYFFDTEKLRIALFHVITHHEALRLCFQNSPLGWQTGIIKKTESVPFSVVDLSALESGEQSLAVENKSAQFQGTLDLSNGPLLRVVYFDLGTKQPHRLLLIVHHFALDAFSWSIFLNDLFTVYQQLQHNKPVHLPPIATPIKNYAEALATYAHSEVLLKELDYWTTESRMLIKPLPVDYPEGVNQVAVYSSVQDALGEEETKALLALVKYKITINDILLTALCRTYNLWTGEQTTLVEIVNHGRLPLFKSLDLTHTIGYLNFHIPFLLDGSQAHGLYKQTLTISEQYRCLPKGGIGYGVLRYLSDKQIQQQLQQFPSPQWLLNYHGRSEEKRKHDYPISSAKERVRNDRSQQRVEPMHLFIDGLISENHLQIKMQYQENIHKRKTIAMLMQYFLESLREIPIHFPS